MTTEDDHDHDDFIASLRDTLRRSERNLPTSSFGRLWKTGRSAATMARSTLGRRRRGRSGAMDDADRDVIARLVAQLGELKGIAMKTGQILGYIDPTLNDEFRGLLSILQTTSPAMPFATVERTLREAFRERADSLLPGVQREPVAIASIGQVHRAALPDGADVAMKILHPGICDAIRSDFRAARAGAVFARVFAPGAGSSVTEFMTDTKPIAASTLNRLPSVMCISDAPARKRIGTRAARCIANRPGPHPCQR